MGKLRNFALGKSGNIAEHNTILTTPPNTDWSQNIYVRHCCAGVGLLAKLLKKKSYLIQVFEFLQQTERCFIQFSVEVFFGLLQVSKEKKRQNRISV